MSLYLKEKTNIKTDFYSYLLNDYVKFETKKQ